MPKFTFVDYLQNSNTQLQEYDEHQTLKLLLNNDSMNSSLLYAIIFSDAPAKVRRELIQNYDKKNIVFEWAMADYITNRFNWKIIFNGTNRSCNTIDELGEMMIANIETEFPDFSKDNIGKICYYICRKAHEIYPDNKDIENVRVNFFKRRWLI